MLSCNRLRIDPGDGSTVVDYRIENGCVESRTPETNWEQLTPAQISAHVMANTIITEWLRRRMGLHKLLQACIPRLSSMNYDPNDCTDRKAE